MFSIKMINFCKNANCPSSPSLLAFQKGDSTPAENQFIRRHLIECDFCAAEIEFYAHYSQSEEICEESGAEVKIPLPLFQLAEAILNNHQKNFSLLNKLLNETESLTLEKA